MTDGVQTLSLGGCDSVPQRVQNSGGPSSLPFLDTPQFYQLSGWPYWLGREEIDKSCVNEYFFQVFNVWQGPMSWREIGIGL